MRKIFEASKCINLIVRWQHLNVGLCGRYQAWLARDSEFLRIAGVDYADWLHRNGIRHANLPANFTQKINVRSDRKILDSCFFLDKENHSDFDGTW